MPFEVPKAMEADTTIHVGRPKLRLPISENACPVIFLSLVHRTTSQGAGVVSESPASWNTWLASED